MKSVKSLRCKFCKPSFVYGISSSLYVSVQNELTGCCDASSRIRCVHTLRRLTRQGMHWPQPCITPPARVNGFLQSNIYILNPILIGPRRPAEPRRLLNVLLRPRRAEKRRLRLKRISTSYCVFHPIHCGAVGPFALDVFLAPWIIVPNFIVCQWHASWRNIRL